MTTNTINKPTNPAGSARPKEQADPSGNAPAKRTFALPCPRCARTTKRFFRIKLSADGPWVAVCAVCQAQLSELSPFYAYGGTVSPRRRKRRVADETHGSAASASSHAMSA